MPHIQRRPNPQRPPTPPQRPQVPPQSQGYDDRYQDGGYANSPEPGYDSGYNTGQV
ncbi:LytR family transcriptional regulator, partial [Streptomyces sp. SID7499]|nr:LytR family transcriptional regulator [Streptomyces sp. SID7499]